MKKAVSCLVLAALALSSCAYVQTHKNVVEAFHTHHGYRVEQPLRLYSTGNAWYLAVQPEKLRLHYPVLHDSIFLDKVNSPEYRTIGQGGAPRFYRVSAGTAHVLQRSDGYYTLASLVEEMRSINTEPVEKLPAGASPKPILAHMEIEQGINVPSISARTPEKTPLAAKILGGLDFVLVDAPLTLAYNIAIPVMAPFVFFHDFLKED